MGDSKFTPPDPAKGQFVLGSGCCYNNFYIRDLAIVADHEPCDECRHLLDPDAETGLKPSIARELGWCVCGDTDEFDEVMLVYLRSLRDKKHIDFYGSDIAVRLIAYIADERGWTEHGTSIRGAWLTDLGEEVIPRLEAIVARNKKAQEEWRANNGG